MSAPHVEPVQTATLCVTIVAYRSDPEWLDRTLKSLRVALLHAFGAGHLTRAHVLLVDNAADSTATPLREQLAGCFDGVLDEITFDTLAGHGNIGYGAANNMAFANTKEMPSEFLLTLNPDVEMAETALTAGLAFFAANPACGMITPVARAPDGAPLHLVKRYPKPLILAIRGFAPAFVKRALQHRLDDYDMADRPFDAPLGEARIVSGCFMLMRRKTFVRAGGFDERFFLYFEDFDLSLRMSALSAIVRIPDCTIVHAGGGAASKGALHVGHFARSALRFFRKHGW
jgi:GT2 family glycosyltransferase